MPVVINGSTGLTFPDSTSQTTAASAPTTDVILSATSTAAVGAVGTYAFLCRASSTSNPGSLAAGGTDSGSNLRYAHVGSGFSGSGTPSGTWRCMGYAASGSYVNYSNYYYRNSTLYLRIS